MTNAELATVVRDAVNPTLRLRFDASRPSGCPYRVPSVAALPHLRRSLLQRPCTPGVRGRWSGSQADISPLKGEYPWGVPCRGEYPVGGVPVVVPWGGGQTERAPNLLWIPPFAKCLDLRLNRVERPSSSCDHNIVESQD